MIVDNQRYTLEEAQVILKKQACTTYGHDYDVVSKRLDNVPVRVICARCGAKWEIENPSNDATQIMQTIDSPTQVIPRQYP